MNNYIRFKTNIPELIEFSFDEPKIFDSKFNPGEKSYSYGVVWGGENAYLTATPFLNDLLQTIGNLKGKRLYINKVEIEGNKKTWQILDSTKADITPKVINRIDVQSPQKTQPGANSDLSARLDKASGLFTTLQNQVNAQDIRISVLEAEIIELKK
jgi:hypothetical protein